MATENELLTPEERKANLAALLGEKEAERIFTLDESRVSSDPTVTSPVQGSSNRGLLWAFLGFVVVTIMGFMVMNATSVTEETLPSSYSSVSPTP